MVLSNLLRDKESMPFVVGVHAIIAVAFADGERSAEKSA